MENSTKNNHNKLSSLFSISKSTAGMVFIVTIILTIFVHVLTSNFYTVYNLGTLVRSISFVTIVAFGQTLVLVLGGIDLSVASIAAICSMTAAELLTKTALNPYFCLAISLALGFGLGALNGCFISWLKLSPFIVTLASSQIFSGIVYVITKGMPIVGAPPQVTAIGQGMLFGVIPNPFIVMMVIFAVFSIIMKYTPFGRYIFAIGGNENAANIVGIRINKVKILVYALSGLLASCAGVLMVCRLGASQVNIGENWVMPSITAAILGGTSMSGGVGDLGGTLVGGIMMGVISCSITLLSISSYWETIVTGGVVLLAVCIDALRHREE